MRVSYVGSAMAPTPTSAMQGSLPVPTWNLAVGSGVTNSLTAEVKHTSKFHTKMKTNMPPPHADSAITTERKNEENI
jgi:hypothetical protein